MVYLGSGRLFLAFHVKNYFFLQKIEAFDKYLEKCTASLCFYIRPKFKYYVVEVSGPSPNPKTRRRENVAAEVISGPFLVWGGITLAEMNT